MTALDGSGFYLHLPDEETGIRELAHPTFK
jgi:hypothetical protein